MKLSRRDFLKALGAGVAGAAMAWVAGVEAGEAEVETSTTAYGSATDWSTPISEPPTKFPGLDSLIVPEEEAHELLDEIQVWQTSGICTVSVAPGSKIKMGDPLAVNGLGSVKSAEPGDLIVGIAVLDAIGETAAVWLDPEVSFYHA